MMEQSFSFEGCDVCGGDHPVEACPELGLAEEEETSVSIPLSRARITLPHFVEVVDGADGSVRVLATEMIPAKTKLGPYEAKKTTQVIEAEDGFLLRIFQKDGSFVCMDTSDENGCNWMCLIPAAQSKYSQEQNCMAVQMGADIFYLATRNIQVGEEISVWYAPHYARKLGKLPEPDGVTTILLGRQTIIQPEELVTFAADESLSPTRMTADGTPVAATPVKVVSAVPVKSTPPPPRTPPSSQSTIKRVWRNSADTDSSMYAKTPSIKEEPYACKQCHQFLSDEFSLKIHMATYHVENMKEGTSLNASTELQPRKSRVIHSLDHKGPRRCRHCNEEFHEIKELAKHVREHIRQRSNEDRRRKSAPNSERSKKRKSTIPKVLLEPEEEEEGEVDEEGGEDEDVSEDYEPPQTASSPKNAPRKSLRLSSPKGDSAIPSNKSRSPVKSPSAKDRSPRRDVSPNISMEEEALSSGKANRTPDVSASASKEFTSSRKSSRIAAKESGGDKLASKPWVRKSFRLVGGNTGIESVKVTPLIQVKDVTGHSGDAPDDESKSHTLVLSLGSLSKKPAPETGKKAKKAKSASRETATPTRRSRRNRSVKEVDDANSDAIRALDMDNVEEQPGNKEGNDKAQEENEEYYTVTVDLDQVKGEVDEDETIVEAEENELSENVKKEFEKNAKQSASKTKRKQNTEDEEEESAVRYAILDENDMYVCDNCNMTFKTFEELEEHEVSHMQEGRRKKRKTTGASDNKPKGKFQKLLSAPLLTGNEKQNEDGLWECTQCGKAFDKLPYLERHMRGHTDLFKCSQCNRRFARNDSLQKHRCTGNPDDEILHEKKHFCEFCGAGFTMQTYLLRHMSSHTDDFKCEFCNKRFGSKNALRQHVIKCKPDIIVDKSRADEFFPCDQCDKVFSRKATLVNHLKLHSGEYRCETCKKCFSSHLTHEWHMNEANCREPSEGEEAGKHHCTKCDKSFKLKNALNLHVAQDHSEMALFCSMCDKSYLKKEDLLKHMIECAARVQSETQGKIMCIFCDGQYTDPVTFRHHFQEHTHPFKCETCNKMFLRQTGLDNHHCDASKNQPQLCPICGKEIKTVRYMEKHIKVAHGEEQQCAVCDKKFKRADHFLNHKCINKEGVVVMEKKRKTREQRQAEGIQDDRICPVCGKTFSVQSNLTKHMKSHGEKTVPCPQCGKMFYTAFAVKSHVKHVHEESHNVCQYCGKVMKCKNSLYGHINQYHQNTITLYECEICGKQFRQKGNVKKHQLIHSDKKTYSCKYCERKFRFPEQHRRHELWHSGAKHQCTFCNKKFVMPFELKKHLRIYHSGLVYACKYCNLECRYLHTMKRHLERRHYDCDEWHVDPIKFIKGLVGHAGDPVHAALPAPPSGRTMSGQPTTYLRNSNYMIIEDEVEMDEAEDGSGIAAEDMGIPTETRFIITNTDGRTTLAQLPEGTTITSDDIEVSQVGIGDPSSLQIDASTMDSILAGFGTGATSSAAGEHPYIVAEVQGMEGSGGPGTTQTIIIQTDGGDGTFHGIEVDSADVAQGVAAALQGLTNQQTVIEELTQPETAHEEVTTTEATEESVTIIGDITQSDGQSVPIALQGANVSEGEGYIIVPMKQMLDETKTVSILNTDKTSE